jgi:hypothetical protein
MPPRRIVAGLCHSSSERGSNGRRTCASGLSLSGIGTPALAQATAGPRGSGKQGHHPSRVHAYAPGDGHSRWYRRCTRAARLLERGGQLGSPSLLEKHRQTFSRSLRRQRLERQHRGKQWSCAYHVEFSTL